MVTKSRVPVHDPISKATTQCTYHHIQCTLQPSAAISSQPSSAHPVHTHCSSHYIFRAHCSQSSMHTAAMYSYLQPTFNAHCSQLQPSTTIYTAAILSSAHCSYTIQCTLQLYHPVHTAAIPSSAHCSYTIWFQYYTVDPVHLWTTTETTYLQSSQQTLMVDCSSP